LQITFTINADTNEMNASAKISGSCNKIFLSKVRGTGKSILIGTSRSHVKQFWKEDDSDGTICTVAASTGLADYNV
jgi:hypothetical protein